MNQHQPPLRQDEIEQMHSLSPQRTAALNKIYSLLETLERSDNVDDMRQASKEAKALASILFNWKSPTPPHWYKTRSQLPKY